MDFDINAAVAMLLMHNVDFEVINGNDTRGEVRTGIIAKFDEPVRLDFGDRKHGRRVSRIHPASDHKVALKADDFRQMLKEHIVTKDWRAGTNLPA